MTEVPPPPPPPGASGGPPVRGPAAPPPPPRAGGSSNVPPAPAGARGSAAAGGGRPGGGVNKGLLFGIVAAIVAVLGLGVVLVLTDDDGDDVSAPDRTTEITSGSPDDTTGGEIPEPSQEPDGLGDDTELDGLAEDCFDGEMDACDDLYLQADADSDYERYGDTCAGRQEAGSGELCTDAFPD